MQKYQVSGRPFTVREGRVALTEKQASLRAHCLKETKKKGVYEVVSPFQLKIGEVFGFSGQLSKLEASLLEAAPLPEVKKPEPEAEDETPEDSQEEETGSDKDEIPEDEEPTDKDSLTVAILQAQLNLGFMKVKAHLKELGVEVEDNEAVITQEVFDAVVAKVSASEGESDED